VHVPAGAIPKDGPSAGITMATSLLSALLGRAPKAKTCMTGEITLHGKVLPIGGLKEKVLAAQREGMEHLIIPEKNRATYMALPTSVKKRLTVSFVKDFSEVFETMFAQTALKNSELKSTKLETEKLAS
jgi:ATP-dependent Lon protease